MRDIICIGGSSGALDALRRILRQLPADLPAAVFIVRHIAPENSGLLTEILQPNCAMRMSEAVDGETIENNRIYIAPPNQHLLIEGKNVRLADGPKENWARPAIDPLFRTAAQHHGPRSIGVILSGKLDDGAAGLWALKRRGGFAVVQDPEDSSSPDMPRHALAAVDVDVVADAEEIGAMLPEWCRKTTGYSINQLAVKTVDAENVALEQHGTSNATQVLNGIGAVSGVVCPECGGQLWKMNEGPLRYRCHVGHALSVHTFLAQQNEVVETAGWGLVRALEEDIQLTQQALEERLPAAVREAVIARKSRNEEKLQQLRPLLFGDQGEVPFRGMMLHGSADDQTPAGDSTDASPVPRT